MYVTDKDHTKVYEGRRDIYDNNKRVNSITRGEYYNYVKSLR